MISAEFMFTSMAAVVKVTATTLPNEIIVFFRNFLVTLLLLPWMLRPNTHLIGTQYLRFHLLRSLAGLGAMYCFFYSLAHMPLAEATLLRLTTPFFLPFVGKWWLEEVISTPVRWAILIGFIGVIVILKPGFGAFSPVAIIALMGAVCAALAKTSIRRMSDTESSVTVVFYFAFIGSLISAVPLTWTWITPAPLTWIPLLATGIFALLGQLFMTQAYMHAPASKIEPFSYISVIFAGLVGWLFWYELIDVWFFVGAGLIFLAGLLVIYYHRHEELVSHD